MLSTERGSVWGKPSQSCNMLAGIYRLASCWPNPFLFLLGIGCVVLASLVVCLVGWLSSSPWNGSRPGVHHLCLQALSLFCKVPCGRCSQRWKQGLCISMWKHPACLAHHVGLFGEQEENFHHVKPPRLGLFVRAAGVTLTNTIHSPPCSGKWRQRSKSIPDGLTERPDLPCAGFVALSLNALGGPLEAVAFRFVQ